MSKGSELQPGQTVMQWVRSLVAEGFTEEQAKAKVFYSLLEDCEEYQRDKQYHGRPGGVNYERSDD